MNLVAQLAMAAAETEEHPALPMDPLMFGVIAAVAFAALGLVVFSYRNVANRHLDKAEVWAERNGKQLPHGSGDAH